MATHRVVLLVESEPGLFDSLGFALRRRGYHVLAARDGDRAAELLGRNLPDVVVTNLLLAGQSGFQVTRMLKERSNGRVPVVMLSPLTGGAHQDYAQALGVNRFLTAPFAPTSVLAAVETLCPLPGSGTIPWPTSTPA